jgi:hypothetical protein
MAAASSSFDAMTRLAPQAGHGTLRPARESLALRRLPQEVQVMEMVTSFPNG